MLGLTALETILRHNLMYHKAYTAVLYQIQTNLRFWTVNQIPNATLAPKDHHATLLTDRMTFSLHHKQSETILQSRSQCLSAYATEQKPSPTSN